MKVVKYVFVSFIFIAISDDLMAQFDRGDTIEKISDFDVKGTIEIDSIELMNLSSPDKNINTQINEASHFDDTLNQIYSMDSSGINSEFEILKNDFRSSLEESLNGLVLTDLDKGDLENRVNKVVNSYKDNKNYQKLAKTDAGIDDKLKTFGNDEVVDNWISESVLDVKLFDEYPRHLYKDKINLKKELKTLKDLSEQRLDLLQESHLKDEDLNTYHKFLNGKIDFDELKGEVKDSYKNISDKEEKKEYKKFIKEIKRIEKLEKRSTESLKTNEYLQYIEDEYEIDRSDIIEEKGLSREKLNNQLNSEISQEIVENDYLSEYLGTEKLGLKEISSNTIKKEVLDVLDSIDGELSEKLTEKINDPEREIENKEVKELVLKESDKKGILPKNKFFEGVISVSNGDFTVFSLSPNFGHQFNNGLSIGLGLTLHHTQDKEAYIRTALDYKAFGKYEFLKELIFLQVEYATLVPGISYLEAKEGAPDFNSTFLIGGGASLKIKEKKVISIGLMYNTNQAMGLPTYDSPFLARFGIKLF